MVVKILLMTVLVCIRQKLNRRRTLEMIVIMKIPRDSRQALWDCLTRSRALNMSQLGPKKIEVPGCIA